MVYARASRSILAHRTLKKATDATEEPLCVYSKSTTKLITSICLCFMHISGQHQTDPYPDRLA
jgi:hypothetical protein